MLLALPAGARTGARPVDLERRIKDTVILLYYWLLMIVDSWRDVS